ncbi:hypothetical protein PMIN04_003684 [Paraphaeosphaeria minitans]
MRQFATVSFSPWANPYSTGPNAGDSRYAPPAAHQPVYRRIVLPPTPIFYHPGVEQVVGEESDDDDSEEGQSHVPVARETPIEIPIDGTGNLNVESNDSDAPPVVTESPPDASTTSDIHQPDGSHQETQVPGDDTVENGTADASTFDNAGEVLDLEGNKTDDNNLEEHASDPNQGSDGSNEPGDAQADHGDLGKDSDGVEETTSTPTSGSNGEPLPINIETTSAVEEEAVQPVQAVEDFSHAPTVVSDLEAPNEAPVNDDSAQHASNTPSSNVESSQEEIATSDGVVPVPPIDTAQELAEKSGECEQAAQEPPMSPTTKSVHFSPDVKDPDAVSIGSKKKGIAKKVGKGKATGFVRIRDPVPVRPASSEEKRKPVKEDRKKAVKDNKKDKEPIENEIAQPATSKKKPSKADERKKKKHDEKEKKSKGRKTRKGSDASHIEDEPAAGGDEKPDSSVIESVAAPPSDDLQPVADSLEELATDPPDENQLEDVLNAEVPQAVGGMQAAENSTVAEDNESAEKAETADDQPDSALHVEPSDMTDPEEIQPTVDASTDPSNLEGELPADNDAADNQPDSALDAEPSNITDPEEIQPAVDAPTDPSPEDAKLEDELPRDNDAADEQPDSARDAEPSKMTDPEEIQPAVDAPTDPSPEDAKLEDKLPTDNDAADDQPAEDQSEPSPPKEPEPDDSQQEVIESEGSPPEEPNPEEPNPDDSQHKAIESEDSPPKEAKPDDSQHEAIEPKDSPPEEPKPDDSQHEAIEPEGSPPEASPGSEEAALEDGEDANEDHNAEPKLLPLAQETDQGDKQPDEVQVSSEPDMLKPEAELPNDTPIENVAESPKTQEYSVDDATEHLDEDGSTEQPSEAGNEDPPALNDTPITVEYEDVDPAATGNVETQSSNGNDASETSHAIDDGTATEQDAQENTQAHQPSPPEEEDTINETGACPVEDLAVIAESCGVDDLVEESETAAESESTANDESNEKVADQSPEEKPSEPSIVSNAVLEHETTIPNDLPEQSEAASDCAPVEESEPNPLDVAIVERVLKAHSVASSAGDDGKSPDTATIIPEASQDESPNQEDQQNPSGATTLVCNADAGRDDASSAPKPCEVEAGSEFHKVYAETEAHDTDPPEAVKSNDTADSGVFTTTEVDAAESEAISAETSSETPNKELVEDQGTEVGNIEPNGTDAPPVDTDTPLDTSATSHIPATSATVDPTQPGDSEQETQNSGGGAVEHDTTDLSDHDNPSGMLEVKEDDTHNDSPDEQTNRPNEDSVVRKDVIPVAADLDPQSDDSANEPGDAQVDRGNCGDDGDGVEETTSATISGSIGEPFPTGTEATFVVQEAVVDSSHDSTADPPMVDQEENSTTVSDLQVLSDAPINDKPAEQASNASDLNDEPSDTHAMDAIPEFSTGGSVNDVVDEPPGGDTGHSHPQSSDIEAEEQPEVPAPATPDAITTEIENTESDAIEEQGLKTSSEHLVDPVTTIQDTISQEPLAEERPTTSNGDIENPPSTVLPADASATSVVDKSVSSSPTPEAEEQESEPSGIEPSPAVEVKEDVTAESHASVLDEDSQAAIDPNPVEVAAPSVEAPVLEEAAMEDVPVLQPPEDLVSEAVPQDAMPEPLTMPDTEEVGSGSTQEPLAKVDVTPEQESPSPDAIAEPPQNEAAAAALDKTVASEAVAEGTDGGDVQEEPSSGQNNEQNEASTEQPGNDDAPDASRQAENPHVEQPESNDQESSPVAAEPAVVDTVVAEGTTEEAPVHPDQQEGDDGEDVAGASAEARAEESGDQAQEATRIELEKISQDPLDEEMDEVQPTTPPGELEETATEVPTEETSTKPPDLESSQALETVPSQEIEPQPAPEPGPPEEANADAAEVLEVGEAPVEPSQDHVTQPVTEEPLQVSPMEESAPNHEPLEQDGAVDESENFREAVPPATEENLDPAGLPEDKQPRTPPNESALVDEPTPDTTPTEKHRRRHSHAHRESRHSHRRHESNASASERPTLNPMALLAAAKLVGSAKSKRRDSLTDREYGRHQERMRETQKASSSSKERSHREHRSHRHHRDRGDDKQSKRRTIEEVEAEAERRQRREARHAEKERIAREEAAREAAEEEERRQKHREERRAKRAEQERLRKEEEGRLAREAGERHAREEEERQMRHEKRRLKHEAEKEAKRLEGEKADHAEEEKRSRRKGKLAPKDAEINHVEARDAARRAAEEEDESVPESPITPREHTRRHTSDRRREAPPPRRNSMLGGLFGRSKTEPVAPNAKSIKPVARIRTDPTEAPPSPVEALRKEREDRANSQHSSNESRERGERSHRSRRHSHAHRRFNSAEEESEYHARKEQRRRAKEQELEMSGARDGGVSLSATVDDAPAREPAEPAAAPEPQQDMEDGPPSRLLEDAAVVVDIASTSSNERRERRRAARHVSIVEHEHEGPKSRRISGTDRERLASRHTESGRARTRGAGEERARPRRSETERSRSSKKREDNGIKGFFGGLKRIVA